MSKTFSGKALVVQLTETQMRIAKTTLGSPMPQLQATLTVDLPDGVVTDGTIRQIDLLKDMLKNAIATEPEFRRVKRVVFVLCTTQVISEQTTMPPVPMKRLDKMLESNMDMYFPVDTQNYHLTWQVVEEKNENGEMALQLWAVPTAMVRAYYALANACGLSVVAMDYCGTALAAAVDASFAVPAGKKKAKKAAKPARGKKKAKTSEEELSSVAVAEEEVESGDAAELVLMAERDYMLMLFVQNGHVKLQRMFLCGSNPDADLGEVMMAVDYFDTMVHGNYSGLSCVLCGELASDPDYVSRARAALDVPVHVLPALSGPAWTLCAGGSRCALDFGLPGLNRPNGMGQISNAWQYGLILAGGIVLAMTMVTTLGAKTVWTTTINGLESTKQTLQIQAAQNANFAQNYYDYQSAYKGYSNDWDGLFDSLRTYNDNLVLILNELETTLPAGTSVTGIQIADLGLGLSLASPTKEEAAYTIMALRKLQYASLDSISDLIQPSFEGAPTVGGEPAPVVGGEAVEAPPVVGGIDYDQLMAILGATQGSSNQLTNEQMMELIESMMKENDSSSEGSETIKDLISDMMKDESFSKEEIAKSLMDLTPEELNALEQAYGKHPKPDEKMEDLLEEAQFRDRKNALESMFSSDPFAMYRFYQLFQIDMNRPVRDIGDGRKPAVLHGDVYKGLMSHDDLIGSILSGQAVDPQKSIDTLVSCLTKDEACLSSTEKLMEEDPMLYNRYAFYLAVELGYEKPMDSPVDIDAIMKDFIAGSRPDVDDDDALDDALDSLFPDIPSIKPDKDEEKDELPDWVLDIIAGNQSSGSSGNQLPSWILDAVTGNSGTVPNYPSSAPVEPADDRFHYNVILGYKPALIEAERLRKGLDYSVKVPELEVEG